MPGRGEGAIDTHLDHHPEAELLFGLLETRTPYCEDRYLAALRRRGSPTAQHLELQAAA